MFFKKGLSIILVEGHHRELRCATGKKSHFGSFRQLEQVNCVLHSNSWRLARTAKCWTTVPTFFPIAACILNSADYTMSWAFRSTCCASVGKSPMLVMVASSRVWCCIECRREGLSPKMCVSLIAVDCGEKAWLDMLEEVRGGKGEEERESIAAEKPISRRDRPLHPGALRRLSLEVSQCARNCNSALREHQTGRVPTLLVRSSEFCITNAWLDIPLPRTLLRQRYRCFNSKLHVCRATDSIHQFTIPIRLHQTAT